MSAHSTDCATRRSTVPHAPDRDHLPVPPEPDGPPRPQSGPDDGAERPESTPPRAWAPGADAPAFPSVARPGRRDEPPVDRPVAHRGSKPPPSRQMGAGGSAPPPSARPRPPKTQSPTPPPNESPDPDSNIPHAGPPRPPRRPDLQPPEAFLTKDQKASTSTGLRCGSWTRTWGIASACRAAIRSHRPMVSYLWPVISSVALRLPRRITTGKVRAISWRSVRRRYRGVPQVGPNERRQTRQTQRGRPPLLPLRTTWVAPQWGQGGWGAGFRAIAPTSFSVLPPMLLHITTGWSDNRSGPRPPRSPDRRRQIRRPGPRKPRCPAFRGQSPGERRPFCPLKPGPARRGAAPPARLRGAQPGFS